MDYCYGRSSQRITSLVSDILSGSEAFTARHDGIPGVSPTLLAITSLLWWVSWLNKRVIGAHRPFLGPACLRAIIKCGVGVIKLACVSEQMMRYPSSAKDHFPPLVIDFRTLANACLRCRRLKTLKILGITSESLASALVGTPARNGRFFHHARS